MPTYGYLVVEGPHDVEFSYRLLSTWGLRRVRKQQDLDPFWKPLVPTTFPHEGDLQKRVPVPLFLQSATHQVAVHDAGGDSQVVPLVEETRAMPLRVPLNSVGIVLDADSEHTPAQRFGSIRDGLIGIGLTMPTGAGEVHLGYPRTGVFVIPDNVSPGTLEDLLFECAKLEYPKLLLGAMSYVDAVDELGEVRPSDAKVEFFKRAGKKKAIVGCVANVLKPGKAVQNSIQDNRWLRGDAQRLPRIAAVREFLRQLFELP